MFPQKIILCLYFAFVFQTFLFQFGHTPWQREYESHIHWLAAYNGPGSTRSKPGTRCQLVSPHDGRNGTTCCLQGHLLAKAWDHEYRQDHNPGPLIWNVSIPRGGLTTTWRICLVSPPENIYRCHLNIQLQVDLLLSFYRCHSVVLWLVFLWEGINNYC